LQNEKIKQEECKALAKQKAKEEEERKEAEAKAKREAELASMTPLQRAIEELIEVDKTNTPKSTLLFNAIKSGKFENDKLEALNILKEMLIEEKKWKEKSTAKKPEKDKAYKRTFEVISMMKNS